MLQDAATPNILPSKNTDAQIDEVSGDSVAQYNELNHRVRALEDYVTGMRHAWQKVVGQ